MPTTHKNYLLRLADGSLVLDGMVQETVYPELLFVAHHPREIARILGEHPELPVEEIIGTVKHIPEEVEGHERGPYSCVCADCMAEHAEQQRHEIDAEMAIERHYEQGYPGYDFDPNDPRARGW